MFSPGLMLLVGRVGMGVTRVQFGNHVDERHVHEDAGRPHEDPRGKVLEIAQQNADHHAHKGKNRAGINIVKVLKHF